MTPPAEPTPRQIAAAEVVAEKVADKFLSGIDTAASQNPREYLMVVLVVASLLAIMAVVLLFLRFLKNQEMKADEREGNRQDHMETMASSFTEQNRESQRSCHAHSVEMIRLRNEGDVILREHSRDLKDITSDLSKNVHDFKNTAQAVKYVVDKVLDREERPKTERTDT